MDQTALDSVTGWCDGYQRGHVHGWAWYPRRPQDTVTVQMLIDGAVIAEAAACIARPDLRTAGIGQGRHAFAIPFSLPPDAQTLHVTVRAKDGPVLGGGMFELSVTPEAQALAARRTSQAHLETVFGDFGTDQPRAPAPAPAAARPSFILHCAGGAGDIAARLGTADYSYLFVMRGFRAALRRIGTVHVVTDPAREAAPIHAACLARGEDCFLLSFAPPHATPLGLACPTIPVIAWEFGTIPTAAWDDEPRHDWRHVLRQCGRAIAISGHAAQVIAGTMGPHFPAAGIPTPVHDRFAPLRARIAPMPAAGARVAIDGFIWDSRTAEFHLGMPAPPIPEKAPPRAAPAPSLRGWRLQLAEAARAQAETARRQADAAQRQAEEDAAHQARHAAEAAALAQREAEEAEAAPKTLRHRAGLTRRKALTWYRDVARDALPRPVAGGLSAAGRLAWRVRAAGHPTIQPAPPPLDAAPQPPDAASQPPVIRQPPPQAPRWHPAPDEPPLPEPVLAIFSPDPTQAAPRTPPPDPRPVLTLDGIVFTAVLSPKDGRKNWQDILSAFVLAFPRTPDATLVFKMIGADPAFWWWEFHDAITRLPAFTCRVVVLHGYLDDAQYGELIAATHFVTNASLAEGQCLPLAEFMSAGRPAIAPNHTAMADYITPENAVIVAGDVEYCAWPHDPRNQLVATRYRMNWSSLRAAFVQAHAIATAEPARYRAMGSQAAATMQVYCGDDTVVAALETFFCLHAPAAAPTAAQAAAQVAAQVAARVAARVAA